MRICLMTPTFLPLVGGTEKAADMLVTGLRARGHDVRVLAQAPPRGMQEPTLDYPVTRFKRMPAHHLWLEELCIPIWKLHRRWPFEVALSFGSYPIGYAATLLKRRLNYKAILCPRGNDLYPKSHLWKKPRALSLTRKGYRNADRIIGISQWVDDRLVEELGAGNVPPIDRVFNGIDLAQLDRQLEQAATHRPAFTLPEKFILHLARVTPVKQQLLAMQGIIPLAEALRQRGMGYVFVGEGQDLPRLQELIKEHQLEDVVFALGTRTGMDKAWLFRHATMMVSSSREEACPNVVIESMASGLPMLASDISPHRELIESRGWGMVYRLNEPSDLADKLMQMLDADLSSYRQIALSRRDEFALANMIEGYERVCQKVLAEPSR